MEREVVPDRRKRASGLIFDPTLHAAAGLERAEIKTKAYRRARNEASQEIYRLRKRIDQQADTIRVLQAEISQQRRVIAGLRRR